MASFSLEVSPRSEAILAGLDENGVAIIRNVLAPELCDEAHDVIISHRRDADAKVKSGEEPESRWFGQRFHCRDDVLLSLDEPAIGNAIANVFQTVSAPCATLLGEDAMVVELAAHIVFPEALPQSFHTDTAPAMSCQVVTCFVALHDVTDELGPTEVFPRTHNTAVHAHVGKEGEVCPDDGSQCLRDQTPAAMILQKGDVVVMDSRLLHRGGPRNVGRQLPSARTLLYLTVQAESTFYGDDHTPSLLPEYVRRLPLRDWKKWSRDGPGACVKLPSIELWLEHLRLSQVESAS